MRTTLEDYEEIINYIKELNELAENIPIIVEGKKDRWALERIGVKGNFILMNGMPIYEFCARIAEKYREIIILVDLDSGGEKIYRKMKHYFSQLGVKVNDKFRNVFLRKLNITKVEDAASRLEKIEMFLFRW